MTHRKICPKCGIIFWELNTPDKTVGDADFFEPCPNHRSEDGKQDEFLLCNTREANRGTPVCYQSP